MDDLSSIQVADSIRTHYFQFSAAVNRIESQPTDSFQILRLAEDLDEYRSIVDEVCTFFSMGLTIMTKFEIKYGNSALPDSAELSTLQQNIGLMRHSLQLIYNESLEASHQGRPEIVQQVRSGARGRPTTYIDPTFLAWAYQHRSTSGIAQFLHIGRTRVRELLLEHGIAQPGSNPFHPAAHHSEVLGDDADYDDLDSNADNDDNDDLLDPIGDDEDLNSEMVDGLPPVQGSAGYLSAMSDEELDVLISRLRTHYSRAGLRMMGGFLRRLGHRVPDRRISDSLHRVDPVHRIFDRIRIRRRGYWVPGPNALWHHDGQHGMFSLMIPSMTSYNHAIDRSHSMGYCHPWVHRWLLSPDNWAQSQQQQSPNNCTRCLSTCNSTVRDAISPQRRSRCGEYHSLRVYGSS